MTFKRPTLRRNGKKMTTIQVSHNISIDDIAYILVDALLIDESTRDDGLEQAREMSRKEIEQQTREAFADKGDRATWSDSEIMDDDNFAAELRQIILDKFPEFA